MDIRGGGLLALRGPPRAGRAPRPAMPCRGAGFAARTAVPPAVGSVKPTRIGVMVERREHGQADDADESGATFRQSTSLNPLREAKPGATVPGVDERGASRIVLRVPAYGRGKVCLAPQDTWLWRSRQDGREGPTFFNFWQRLARWVDGVPDRVSITTTPTTVQRRVVGRRLDKGKDNDGRISARVTSPSGKTEDVPMEWTVEPTASTAPDSRRRKTQLYKIPRQWHDTRRSRGRQRHHRNPRCPKRSQVPRCRDARASVEAAAEKQRTPSTTPRTVSKLPDAITYSGRACVPSKKRELCDMPIMRGMSLDLTGGVVLFRRGAVA